MPLVNSAAQTNEFELLLPDIQTLDSNNLKNSRKLNSSRLGTSLHSLKIIKAQTEGCMSRRTKKCLFMLLVLIAFGCLGIIFFGYYCSGSEALCDFSTNKIGNFGKHDKPTPEVDIGKPLASSSRSDSLPGFEEVVSRDFQFDIEGHDVMVFLHIQKTGGTTFGKHLVKNLELERECVCHRKVKRRCTCLRPGMNNKETWLFSRYSTGWKCGLHADWTELTSCVDEVMDEIDKHSVKRRYFYITYLREPVHRYLSEYRHVRRGATWKNALHFCKGQPATEEELPPCYKGEDWSDVTLEEFLSCKSNLANNRQTRMIADLSLVNCYDTSSMTAEKRDSVMLASAKSNLHKMVFFGLTEYQEMNQYLFEETFNLKFNVRFEQYNTTRAEDSLKEIDPLLMNKVRTANHLDVQLYEYGRKLLMQRYEFMRQSDPHFDDHFRKMGHGDFKWDDRDKNR